MCLEDADGMVNSVDPDQTTHSMLINFRFSDPLFVQNIRRFISTKADVLFKPVDTEEQERLEENFEDGKDNEWLLLLSSVRKAYMYEEVGT